MTKHKNKHKKKKERVLKLYTIKRLEHYLEDLKNNKLYKGDYSFGLEKSYKYMQHKLEEKLGKEVDGMVWCWDKDSLKGVHPQGYFKEDTESVIILEITIKEKDTLKSEFNLWHSIMNSDINGSPMEIKDIESRGEDIIFSEERIRESLLEYCTPEEAKHEELTWQYVIEPKDFIGVREYRTIRRCEVEEYTTVEEVLNKQSKIN